MLLSQPKWWHFAQSTHWTRRHLFFYWLPLKFHSPLFPRGHLPDFVMRYKVGGNNAFISVAYITRLYSLTIRKVPCHTKHRKSSDSTENWIVLYVCVRFCCSTCLLQKNTALTGSAMIIERKKKACSLKTQIWNSKVIFSKFHKNKFEQRTYCSEENIES